MSTSPNARSQRRGAVLRAVRASRSPVSVNELAKKLEIHTNTVRFHLRSLEQAGDVVRSRADSVSGPGRPSITYQSVPDQTPERQRADLLAHILLADVTSDNDPLRRAREAGKRWGRLEASRKQDEREESGPDDAIGALIELLEESGFAPSSADADGPNTVDLLHCPLREFVADQGGAACAVHEGMMRGFLEETRAGVSVQSLEPFAAPGLCRTTLIEN